MASTIRESGMLWPDPQVGPWWVKIWWRVQHGVPTPVGLMIKGWVDYPEETRRSGPHNRLPWSSEDVEFPRIERQLVRSLPVGAITDALRDQVAAALADDRDTSGWPDEWKHSLEQWKRGTADDREAFAARPRGGRDLGDEHYMAVAEVYATAAQAGRSPTAAVAAHFHVEKSSAAKKVARARERGFLPKTTKGRIGPLSEDA